MPTRSLLRLALALLLPAALLPAADVSVEDRLKALEQQVRQLAQENTELKQQLGVKDFSTLTLPRPAGKEDRLAIGGFLQAQAEFGRAADPRFAGIRDRFFFRRARVYVAGSFTDDLDFKAELDLQGNTLAAGTGQLARANEIYLGWHKYPLASLRFGQIKSAFGAEQLASDTKVYTIERFLANDRLTDGRQLAASLAGELPAPRLSYLFVVGNGNGVNVSGNDNSHFQKSARVTFTPVVTKDSRLVLGANGLWTEDAGVSKAGFGFTGNTFTGTRSAWGVDADWTWGRLDLGAEWLHEDFKPASAVPAANFAGEGWHATAAYYLLPMKLQAIVRREEFDPNTSLPGTTIGAWTFGVNYLFHGDDLKLMLDYVVGRVPGATDDGGRLLTRLQVVF